MRPALLLILAASVGCSPVIIEDLAEAVLSVRATAPDDVWLFGSDAGDGPLLMRWDGDSWERLDTASVAGQDLWWGFPTASEVFLAGSGGLVGSLDRASGEITVAPGLDPDLTFFGVWGSSPDDVWAVGGGVGTDLLPAVHRWDGTTWGTWAPPGGAGEPGQVYFKVDGTGPDDVWIVGSGSTALRWDGTAMVDTGAAALLADADGNAPPLLTVDVQGDTPVAVGGAGEGVILRWNEGEAGWTPNMPEFAPGLLGVCSGPEGALRAVGGQGSVYDWDGATWSQWERGITPLGLHGCVYDLDGGFWTGGGSIASEPLVDGILIYEGGARVKQL